MNSVIETCKEWRCEGIVKTPAGVFRGLSAGLIDFPAEALSTKRNPNNMVKIGKEKNTNMQ